MGIGKLLTLGIFSAVLGSASPAMAATFDGTPATYNRSGAGPFTYQFHSTAVAGPSQRGGLEVQYRPGYWHRCEYPTPRLTQRPCLTASTQ